MSLDHQDLDDLVNLATDIGTAHKQATEHPDVITQQESQDLDQFHEEAKQTAQDLDPQSVAADGAELPDPPEITADSVWSFLGSCGINLILPFINGVMLGFGEILAHEIGFRYNWSGAKVSIPHSNSPLTFRLFLNTESRPNKRKAPFCNCASLHRTRHPPHHPQHHYPRFSKHEFI